MRGLRRRPTMSRTFEDRDAVREQVPLLVGLTGASSSGKTLSALRLAAGMQKITGGDIFCIDTESKRALHYADQFNFRHVEFTAPFSPLDYLAAIEHCTKAGAKTVIVDSASHEHEGPGGVLEWHDAETERLAALWKVPPGKAQLSAWQKPKAARRRLLNTVLQLGINAIFCFRAKQKLKIVKGEDPLEMGWMPICGEEFAFEMTVNCLLYPASGGVPTWKSDMLGERTMMKLPVQFEEVFREPRPLDENIGIELAEWARGGLTPAEKPPMPTDDKDGILRDIKHEFVVAGLSGSSDHEKAERKACLKDFFGASSWNEVEALSAKALKVGLELLRAHLGETA
jgi:hypothetical protein